MSHTAKHTPTPWKFWDRKADGPNALITDEAGKSGIARPIDRIRDGVVNLPEMRVNAEFIVHACNFHKALVDALADVLDTHPDDLDPQLPPEVKERYRKAWDVWNRAEGNTP